MKMLSFIVLGNKNVRKSHMSTDSSKNCNKIKIDYFKYHFTRLYYAYTSKTLNFLTCLHLIMVQ